MYADALSGAEDMDTVRELKRQRNFYLKMLDKYPVLLKIGFKKSLAPSDKAFIKQAEEIKKFRQQRY